MKNFRKVLALVLVVATLFSFAAMASAADYKDADKISYTEAVNVLSHVGILEGYPEDGTFRPANTITRAEMAKMIAVLANAGYDVKDLFSSDVKFADSKDHWAASYIAYCTSTGIVAGRSNTTFDPQGKVTGLETAKMLLVVLGFDAQKQGYVGADWKLNVKRDAKLMGLLENFHEGYNPDTAITREEAAQMMLNALEAPCVVGYLANDKITVTNAIVFKNLIVSDTDLKGAIKVVSHATLKDALKKGEWALYGNVLISNTILGEQLFGLVRSTNVGRDHFGRPGTSWTYKALDGTTHTIASTSFNDVSVFASNNTTSKKLAAALEKYGKLTADLYVDGYKTMSGKSIADTVDFAKVLIGKGVQVEAYYTATPAKDEAPITIVIINTYIGKIDNVNTALNTFEIVGENGTCYDRAVANKFGITIADEGKIALFHVCRDGKFTNSNNYTVHDAEIITPVTAKVTSANIGPDSQHADSNFVADGKNYEYAWNFNNMEMSQDLIQIGGYFGNYGDPKDPVGKSLNIYLDKAGFVMWFEEVASEVTYGVIPDASVVRVNTGDVQGLPRYAYTSKLVNFEKNPTVKEDIKVTKSFYDLDNAFTMAGEDGTIDSLVKYYKDADGMLVGSNKGMVEFKNVTLSNKAEEISGISKYVVDNGTKILMRIKNVETGKFEYKFFDGKSELDTKYICNDVQFFAAPNGHVTYMYAQAQYAGEATTAFILAKNYHTIKLTEGGNLVEYTTYKALINGEEAIIAFNGVVSAMDRVYNAQFKCVGYSTVENKPVYMVVNPEAGLTVGNDGFKFYDGVLTWNDGASQKDVDKDAKLVLVFPENGQFDDDHNAATPALRYMTLKNMDELKSFAQTYGWDHMYGYGADTDNDKDFDVLYILLGAGPENSEH